MLFTWRDWVLDCNSYHALCFLGLKVVWLLIKKTCLIISIWHIKREGQSKMKFLTEEQREFYAENGYIKLSGIFTNDFVDELSREYDSLFARKKETASLDATWKGDWKNQVKDTSDVQVQSIHNLQVLSKSMVKRPEALKNVGILRITRRPLQRPCWMTTSWMLARTSWRPPISSSIIPKLIWSRRRKGLLFQCIKTTIIFLTEITPW